MKRHLLIFSLLLCSIELKALPIDWHGVLGFDTTSIHDYRRLDSNMDNSNLGNANSRGTQEVPLGPGGNKDANWQSYIFRLEPHLIVNDAATIKAEISSGHARGGRVGDDNSQSKEAGFGNSLYPYAFSSGNDTLNINKLFMELYSDTATYLIGRHSSHYGLGAIINSGDDTWDRHSFTRDGITIKVKIGSFGIEPFWTRVGSGNSLTKATRTKEYGFALSYDNIERDLAFGILLSKKKSAPLSTDYTAGTNTDLPATSTGYSALGKTDVKMTDIFFKKDFGRFGFGLEVPLMSGEVGNVYSTNTKYKAKAILFESKFKASESMTFQFNGGRVSGDDGNSNNFEAMYLNPNYQVANLLFRHNLRAIGESSSKSVYDSYINNALYAKFAMIYQTEKWTWETSFIWAKAEEVATAGNSAYNHLTNKQFIANENQQSDLGYEIDVDFVYKWNNEITIGGNLGYLFTGDYFGYTNNSVVNAVKNTYLLQLKTAITF